MTRTGSTISPRRLPKQSVAGVAAALTGLDQRPGEIALGASGRFVLVGDSTRGRRWPRSGLRRLLVERSHAVRAVSAAVVYEAVQRVVGHQPGRGRDRGEA